MMTQQRFDQLKAEWDEGTRFFSLPAQIFGHPAYRAIIGEGQQIIPMILAEMETQDKQGEDYEGPDFWFRALYEILNSEPDQGSDPPIVIENGFTTIDVPRANRLWLDWAKGQGWKPSRSENAWIDAVFDEIEGLLCEEGFETVDRLFANVHVELTPLDLLVGYLTITFSTKQKLAERATFFGKVRAEVIRRGMADRVEGLLLGLE